MGREAAHAWGFKNAQLEPWDFGHPGWLNERAAGYIVAPVHENLKFEVLAGRRPPREPSPARWCNDRAAWTRDPACSRWGTRRTRPSRAASQQPTQAELDQWMDANKDKIRNKIVMVGKAAVIPVNFAPPALRRDDEQVKASYDPNGNGGDAEAAAGAALPIRIVRPRLKSPSRSTRSWWPTARWSASTTPRWTTV